MRIKSFEYWQHWLFNQVLSRSKLLIPMVSKKRLTMGYYVDYASNAVVNPTAELDNSKIHTRRTNAIYPFIGVFFCPSIYGSRARDTVRCADFLVCRFVNSRTAAALILDKINGSSNLSQGAISMSSNDKSRLCAENRALLDTLHKHLSLLETEDLNITLHEFAASQLAQRANKPLNQAVYDLKVRFNRIARG